MHRTILVIVFAVAATAAAQSPKYPWQYSGTQCNEAFRTYSEGVSACPGLRSGGTPRGYPGCF
jgi:hypothetical protein